MAQSVKPDAQKRGTLLAWLALPALLLAGCGAGKGDVTGEVKYKGELLPYGRITFFSEVGQHRTASAYIVRGKYTMEGFPAGPVKVSIESLRPPTKEEIEKSKKDAMGAEKPFPPGLTDGPPLKYVMIPSKYSNADKSGLEFTVEKGSQTKDFPLTEK